MGGEGTLVALLVARQPVVQPAAAGRGQEVTRGLPGSYQGVTRGEQGVTTGEQGAIGGYQGVTRGLPGRSRGVRLSWGREQRG